MLLVASTNQSRAVGLFSSSSGNVRPRPLIKLLHVIKSNKQKQTQTGGLPSGLGGVSVLFRPWRRPRGQGGEVQQPLGLPSSRCTQDSGNESLPHSGLSLVSKHTSSPYARTAANAWPLKFDKGGLMKGMWKRGGGGKGWRRGEASTRAHTLISYSILSAAMPGLWLRLIPHLSLCY